MRMPAARALHDLAGSISQARPARMRAVDAAFIHRIIR
jgi:hypothetical protein